MMYGFNFLRPESAEEACKLLAEFGDRAKIIAGGQSLLILLKQRLISPEYLISIKDLKELDYIKWDGESSLRIGALTPHRSVETSPSIKTEFSVLAEAERDLASVQIRNWGTIGGNICHADPASDLVPPLIALEAKVKIRSISGIREIPLEEFYRDYYETTLKPEEMLVEICIPKPRSKTGIVYSKFSLRRVDMAVVGVAVSITMGSGNRVCKDLRIVLGSVGPVPRRVIQSENMMRMKSIDKGTIEEAAVVASEEVEPVADIYFSENYRREIVKVLVREAITQATQRAGGN
jgi:carbon-monoxide dehydrogenase medium subunit